MVDNVRKTIAVLIEPEGGDNPLEINLVIPERSFIGTITDTAFVGSGGVPPYSFAIVPGSGDFPDGGSISGTPGLFDLVTGAWTTQGTSVFIAEMTDSASDSIQQSFSITIIPDLVIYQGYPTPGEVGVAYSFRVVVRNFAGEEIPSGYTIDDPPTGLTQNTNGLITGTPTTDGRFDCTLHVSYGGESLQWAASIEIFPPMVSHTLPSDLEPRPYVLIEFFNKIPTTYATGGNEDGYFFQWDNLTDYPWLRFGLRDVIVATKGSQWVFSGTPPYENVGVRQVITGTCYDGIGGQIAVEFAFTPILALPTATPIIPELDGTAAQIFHVEFDDLGSDTVKRLHFPYNFQTVGVSAFVDAIGDVVFDFWVTPFAGAPPTITDSITGGNPLTLSSSIAEQDSTLTDWTPLIPQDSVMIVNASGVSGVVSGTVTIWGIMGTPTPTPIVITGGPMPDGAVGNAYTHTLTITGGNPPYVDLTFSADLPDGITASIVLDEIQFTGTPTTAGLDAVAVQCGDGIGHLSSPYPISILVTESIGAWVNILDVPDIVVTLTGGFVQVGDDITFDTGNVSGTGSNLGDVQITAPIDLAIGHITMTRITSITVDTLTTPAAATTGDTGYHFVRLLTITGGFVCDYLSCYKSDESGEADYGYSLESTDADGVYNGPGWGPSPFDHIAADGCPTAPFQHNDFDLSTYVNSAGTFEPLRLSAHAQLNGSPQLIQATGVVLIEVFVIS